MISVTIQNAIPMNSSSELGINATSMNLVNHSVNCDIGSPFEKKVQCPNGDLRNVACNGSWHGAYTATCPFTYAEPVCSFLIDGVGVTNNCTVLQYTAHNTTCVCSLSALYDATAASRKNVRSQYHRAFHRVCDYA